MSFENEQKLLFWINEIGFNIIELKEKTGFTAEEISEYMQNLKKRGFINETIKK